MRELGVICKYPTKRHRYVQCDGETGIVPNRLRRQFRVDAPDKVWCGDITFVNVGNRWGYCAMVMDLYARKIVGWAYSEHPDTPLTIRALRMAYETRGRPEGVLFHSDQGCQYTSYQFRQQVRHYGMRQSMNRRGNCYDNAPMERFFRSYKSEWMPYKGYPDFASMQRDCSRYIRYYNYHRLHSYNSYLSPVGAEVA